MQELDQDIAQKVYLALIEDRLDDARELMRHPGHDIPKLIWSPSTAMLSKAPLVAVLETWAAMPKHQGTQIPHYDAFDVLNFRDALGHCVYLDVVGEGEDFRYRVYGSKLAAAVGFDMTGRLLSEFPFQRRDAAIFAVNYKAVWHRKQTLYSEHCPKLPNENGQWFRLTVPFAGDDGQVARMLTANVYDVQGSDAEDGVRNRGFLSRDALGSLRHDASS